MLPPTGVASDLHRRGSALQGRTPAVFDSSPSAGALDVPTRHHEHLTRREREIVNAVFALGNKASAETFGRASPILPPPDLRADARQQADAPTPIDVNAEIEDEFGVTLRNSRVKVFETQPIGVDEWDSKSRALSIRLAVEPGALEPGKYDCQISVLDPAGQKAAYWREGIVIAR